MFRVRRSFAIAWVAGLSASPLAVPVYAGSPIDCTEGAAPFATVEAISALDGTTIRLKDGREIRLASVVAPDEIDGDKNAAKTTTNKLSELVAGHRLVLYGRETLSDRYGRLVAQITLADPTRWFQADLVTAGLLRVLPETSEFSCAPQLLRLEAAARRAKRGMWGNENFSVVQAENIEALNAALGRFTLVEGIIRHIGETTSRTYLDFGRRYNADFTIVIPRSARASFAAAGMDFGKLKGKQVRVRGVLFSSGGPAIEIRRPESLEIVSGGGA